VGSHTHIDKKCSVLDCESAARASGYCSLHFSRVKRHGTVDAIGFEPRRKRPSIQGCSVVECSNDHYAKGLCRYHYSNARGLNKLHICAYPRCSKKTINKYCYNCSVKIERRDKKGMPISATQKELFSGEFNPRWNNGASEYNNHTLMKKVRKQCLGNAGHKCQAGNCDNIANRVHHLDGGKDNHELANLLAVCTKCHGKFHRGPLPQSYI